MNSIEPTFAVLLQRFFIQRLMQQKKVSSHTLCSYRDTFRLLLRFAEKWQHVRPEELSIEQIDAPFVTAFLNDLERSRGVSARTRNLRLTAIRSFFRFASYELPSRNAQIQRVLATPRKKYTRRLIGFLTRPEVKALLDAPDKQTWTGRRDHALLLLTIQTGLRLSEVTGLTRQNLTLGKTAYLQVIGKGRKERAVPLCKSVATVLKSWLREPRMEGTEVIFPSIRGGRLSADAVQHLLNKHLVSATKVCSSIGRKKITFHCLRHTMAMDLLHAGIEQTAIALWLGHESIETTQMYLDADLVLREKILAKTTPIDSRSGKYRPTGQLLSFLNQL
ncbi:MAG: tyrosine-type recombinase/integrase [Gallionella sp.]|jgi:site-specific recombinase XerD|nr:tyrosine-type recombinase/integrase [Gallionella sp.]